MITIVAGFGRCGSSLTMQMLAAGGLDMAGPWPSYEDPIANIGGAFMEGDKGACFVLEDKVVKVLDPHLGRLPPWDYRVIWCKREYDQQGKSQAKFLRLMTGMPANRETARAFARSYQQDEPNALAALRAAGQRSFLCVYFETTLRYPERAAKSLADFCGIPAERIPAMAAVVRARSPKCAPGLEMELSLIEGAAP